MSAAVNVVVLVGNLTREPELKQTANGGSVCKLGIAVNESWKDAEGNWSERPNFFDVDVFGRQGEMCAQYLAKGRQVAVDGRLRWRSWEAQDGSKRSAVSVVADHVQFIGGKREGDAFDQAKGFVAAGEPAKANGYQPDDDDESIPF